MRAQRPSGAGAGGREAPAGSASLRSVRLALAGLWAADALLQLQPGNFTSRLVSDTILSNAMSQPEPIRGSIVLAAWLAGPVHVELNIAIVAVQLVIAAGIAWRGTTRVALLASIAWALGVWWLGEGFGGVFGGTATLLVGAPGAAVLYALLALVVLPAERPRPRGRWPHAVRRLSDRASARAWALLWVLGAVLRVVPFWYAPVYALQGDLQIPPDQAPRWLFHLDHGLARLSAHGGLPLVIAIAAIEAAVGLVALTRHRRAALALGIALSVVYWIIGQQFGGITSGAASDVGAAPLYVLLALSLWTPRHAPELSSSVQSHTATV